MSLPEGRICTRCGKWKTAENFLTRKTPGRGLLRLRPRCKQCAAKRRREDRLRWSEEKREARLLQMRLSNKLRQFGLTAAEYQAMFEERDGLCDICHQPETRTRNGKVLPLCVDHEAETRKVRGLLCSNHNVGIGYFNHDIVLLEQAIRYLKGSD